ncbi:TetR/AcrR family transcriptional regulator [Streptosporangium sp. NPDC023615]|uniref:TetR/AcrR family transcriptional regulator n=1 Tax=Streptosporangium sp. NPDC023615 TaxID=3154794 RepID=UPI0034188ECA
MTEGLREQKKRRTRRHIHDVALGLFVERGFDHVTIAEVAAAAEVSVNTLYNYFQAKEDLVLDPQRTAERRLADIVLRRDPGESAARAVLDRLRDMVRRHDRELGLTEGFGRVYEMMRAAPTLTARLDDLGRQMTAALAAVLAEETGTGPDDPLPRVVAAQIGLAHSLVFTEIGRLTAAGESPGTIATAVLRLLDVVEDLLGEPVLTYAVRKDR